MILLRHGESEFNAAFNATRVDPGIPDPRLTETGRRQAEAAAEALRGHAVARLIASPYRRALETAAIIAERLDLPVTVDPLVRERAFFVCDVGTTPSDLARIWPHLRFEHLEERWWPTDEESTHALQERCAQFQAAMAAVPDWPNLAVVTHWGFIRALTGHEVTNCAMVRFDPVTGRADASSFSAATQD